MIGSTVIGTLQPEEVDRYVLRALAAQTLIVDITAGKLPAHNCSFSLLLPGKIQVSQAV